VRKVPCHALLTSSIPCSPCTPMACPALCRLLLPPPTTSPRSPPHQLEADACHAAGGQRQRKLGQRGADSGRPRQRPLPSAPCPVAIHGTGMDGEREGEVDMRVTETMVHLPEEEQEPWRYEHVEGGACKSARARRRPVGTPSHSLPPQHKTSKSPRVTHCLKLSHTPYEPRPHTVDFQKRYCGGPQLCLAQRPAPSRMCCLSTRHLPHLPHTLAPGERRDSPGRGIPWACIRRMRMMTCGDWYLPRHSLCCP